MQSASDPVVSEKSAQLNAIKIVILCAGGVRSVVFLPSQNSLVIYEQEVQRKVELGYSSSRILEILVERADEIVSRDDIFTFAWPDRIVGQNSLNQAISTIRELLGDEELREIIQTVPRRGYQFNSRFLSSPTQVIGNPAQAQALPDVTLSAPVARGLTRLMARRGMTKGLMVVVVLLIVGFFLRIDWSLWLQPGLVKQIETQGLLTVWYTGADEEEVDRLKVSTRSIRERALTLLEAPGTVIFNTMHSFYEIVCISGSTVEFVTVHKSKLSTVTDEQLSRCLK